MRTTPMLALGFLVAPAWADLPAVLDYVPEEAALVLSVPNLEEAHQRASAWADAFAIGEAQQVLGMVQMLMGNPGLDAEGSAALVIAEPDFDNDPPMVLVLPVTDFTKFVAGLGGEAHDGVNEIVTPFDVTIYARQLSGSFAVVGPDAELVEDYDGDDGQMAMHKTRMGKTGDTVSEASHMTLIANVEALEEQFEDMAEQVSEGMQQAGAMGGQPEQLEAMGNMVVAIIENFSRDAHVGLLGLNLDEGGMAVDAAANFREGSELAGYFQHAGEPHGMLSSLPAMPYLFAIAMDYSNPGVRSLIAGMKEMAVDINGGAGLDWFEMAGASEGVSMVLGTPAGGIMGGIFSNMITYTAAKDPGELLDTIRGLYADLDGQVEMGIEYETSYEREAMEINGTPVDAWSMTLSVDPNDANAMEGQMALQSMQMLYPGGRPAGYLVNNGSGVLQTMSKNSELVAKALGAKKDGGLSAEDNLKSVAEQLPSDRTAEVYLRIDQMAAMVGPMMAMMGGPAIDIEEGLPPIGLGVSGTNGGARAHLFVPVQVLEAIKNTAEAMNEDQGGGGDSGRPRF